MVHLIAVLLQLKSGVVSRVVVDVFSVRVLASSFEDDLLQSSQSTIEYIYLIRGL